EYFARVCYEADKALGESSAIRYFVNWYDETPRDQMRKLLLAEVERTLAERTAEARRRCRMSSPFATIAVPWQPLAGLEDGYLRRWLLTHNVTAQMELSADPQ